MNVLPVRSDDSDHIPYPKRTDPTSTHECVIQDIFLIDTGTVMVDIGSFIINRPLIYKR